MKPRPVESWSISIAKDYLKFSAAHFLIFPDGTAERIDFDRALACVPDEARALLILRYAEGLSYRELARVRGIKVNTVKSQLARGKSALRSALEEDRR